MAQLGPRAIWVGSTRHSEAEVEDRAGAEGDKKGLCRLNRQTQNQTEWKLPFDSFARTRPSLAGVRRSSESSAYARRACGK